MVGDKGVVYRIARIAAVVGGASLAAMMFLTATDVVLRYAFDRPIIGAYELSEIMMLMLCASVFAYTQTRKGHVSIDILVSRFGPRVQLVISSVTYLFSIILFSTISWRTLVAGQATMRSGLITGMLPIPVYPLYYILVAGFILLSLVLVVDFVELLTRGVKK